MNLLELLKCLVPVPSRSSSLLFIPHIYISIERSVECFLFVCLFLDSRYQLPLYSGQSNSLTSFLKILSFLCHVLEQASRILFQAIRHNFAILELRAE